MPIPKTLPLVVYTPLKLLASAKVATVTIMLCVVVLAWSTLLVGRYGLDAVEYGVYGTWWFALLLLLLGVNVVAATIVKIPWRRSQTGFLVVHAGIIVLLVGCWLTREQGINGQLEVAEGSSSSTVMKNMRHFRLQIADLAGKHKPKTLDIPFESGPFNWCDYDHLAWFPWHWARRDRGTVYEDPSSDVKLEVLDYMADSMLSPVPELVLRTRLARSGAVAGAVAGTGDERPSAEFALTARSFTLRGMAGMGSMTGAVFTETIGSQYQLPTGEFVSFRFVGSEAAVQAFLDASPSSKKEFCGPLGQIVLQVVRGKDSRPAIYRFPLDQMIEQDIVTIGDTSLRVQVTQFIPSKMQARLAVYDKAKPGVRPRILVLNAFQPSIDTQDLAGEVFGSYWFPAPGEGGKDKDKDKNLTAFLDAITKILDKRPTILLDTDITEAELRNNFLVAALPRADLIQGPGEKGRPQLYVREWDGRRVTHAGVFRPEAKKIEWFAGSGQPLQVEVVGYTPADTPGEVVRAVPYNKKKAMGVERVQVRLTVGAMCETFWLLDPSSPGVHVESPSDVNKTVIDGDRCVTVSMRRDELELGFAVRLNDFTIEYAPGSRAPLRYASQVDVIARPALARPLVAGDVSKPVASDGANQLYENLTIEENRPATLKDPVSGRAYRFFQSSYRGPIRPGQPEFERFVGGSQKRDTLYFSCFSVSYDPGRFWKYAGCFMIIFGTAIMYYMRAYFFRRFSSKIETC